MFRSYLSTLLLLLPTLLVAQDDVPPGMTRYVNEIDAIDSSLRNRYLPFRFDYPSTWVSQSSRENPTNFILVSSPRSLTDITTSGQTFSVGPLEMEGSWKREDRMRAARDLLSLMEPQLASGFHAFRRDSIVESMIDSLEGVQLLFTAQPRWKGNIPAGKVFGRILVVPPAEMNGGFVIAMVGDSGVESLWRSTQLGATGQLEQIARSFRVTREKQEPKPMVTIEPLPAEGGRGTTRYRQTRELLPEGLASAYVPFEFNYPRTWRVTPGKLLGNTFVQVNNVIEARGEETFMAEGISVGSVSYLFSNDSARLAMMPQVMEMVETQISRSYTYYRRSGIGPVMIGGVQGYEVRGGGTQPGEEFSDVNFYVRVIMLPPTTKRPGLLIALTSCSLIDGMTSAEMVGEQGELAGIIRSFKVLEEE